MFRKTSNKCIFPLCIRLLLLLTKATERQQVHHLQNRRLGKQEDNSCFLLKIWHGMTWLSRLPVSPIVVTLMNMCHISISCWVVRPPTMHDPNDKTWGCLLISVVAHRNYWRNIKHEVDPDICFLGPVLLFISLWYRDYNRK